MNLYIETLYQNNFLFSNTEEEIKEIKDPKLIL